MRLKITLEPGETKNVSVGGSRFYYEVGLGIISVHKLSAADAVDYELSPGMGFQNKDGEYNFFGVQIKNLHSIAQTIEFWITNLEIFDNRVNFSRVAVDTEKQLKDRVSASYIKSRWNSGGPGTFGAVALRNLTGSPKNVWVEKIIVGTPINSRILIHSHFDMATVEANAAVSALNAGDNTNTGKKFQFGPGGFSWCVTDGFVSSSVGFAGLQMFSGYCNGSFVLDLKEPIRITPAAGIWVTNFEANTALAVSFEVYEEAI